MSQLISVRTNIFYSKVGEEYKRNQELVFLVDKPTYKFSNEGEVIRERGIEEVRIMVGEYAYDQLLEILTKFKTIEESELK